MRTSAVNHRRHFTIGALVGLSAVIIKLLIVLPVDVANILYGIALLITLIITVGEVTGTRIFVMENRILDFIVGLLFPLDFYAVLILFGLHLPD